MSPRSWKLRDPNMAAFGTCALSTTFCDFMYGQKYGHVRSVLYMCQVSPILGVSGAGSSCVSWLTKANLQQPQQSQSLLHAFKKYTFKSRRTDFIVFETAVRGLSSAADSRTLPILFSIPFFFEFQLFYAGRESVHSTNQ